MVQSRENWVQYEVREKDVRRVRGQENSGDVITGRRANFNRRKTRAIEGDHLIQCDITGQTCLRSEARMTWRGLLVSNQNWDVKHPQLTINVPPEDISVPDARPFKSSDSVVGSDILQESTVSISDQTVLFTGGTPVYTLTNKGLVITTDDGTITQEWWGKSPVETDVIGNFFQVKASVIDSANANPVGIFGVWQSLVTNQSWTIDNATDGGVDIFVQIRDIATSTVIDSATITLGVLGLFGFQGTTNILGFDQGKFAG